MTKAIINSTTNVRSQVTLGYTLPNIEVVQKPEQPKRVLVIFGEVDKTGILEMIDSLNHKYATWDIGKDMYLCAFANIWKKLIETYPKAAELENVFRVEANNITKNSFCNPELVVTNSARITIPDDKTIEEVLPVEGECSSAVIESIMKTIAIVTYTTVSFRIFTRKLNEDSELNNLPK